jgi:NADPH:quinone reductase-like Zn-dependent oxidoreductase
MSAVVRDAYGSADVLRVGEVDKPVAGRGGGVPARACGVTRRERSQDLEELRNLLEAGTIKPVVDRTFPLDEVPEAIYLRDGHARGKIVITT